MGGGGTTTTSHLWTTAGALPGRGLAREGAGRWNGGRACAGTATRGVTWAPVFQSLRGVPPLTTPALRLWRNTEGQAQPPSSQMSAREVDTFRSSYQT